MGYAFRENQSKCYFGIYNLHVAVELRDLWQLLRPCLDPKAADFGLDEVKLRLILLVFIFMTLVYLLLLLQKLFLILISLIILILDLKAQDFRVISRKEIDLQAYCLEYRLYKLKEINILLLQDIWIFRIFIFAAMVKPTPAVRVRKQNSPFHVILCLLLVDLGSSALSMLPGSIDMGIEQK